MEKTILTAASIYTMKHFFNEEFKSLPKEIKDELIEIVTIYSAKLHCVVIIGFYDDGEIYVESEYEETDYQHDEINAGLELIKLEKEKSELFTQLCKWYNVVYKGN